MWPVGVRDIKCPTLRRAPAPDRPSCSSILGEQTYASLLAYRLIALRHQHILAWSRRAAATSVGVVFTRTPSGGHDAFDPGTGVVVSVAGSISSIAANCVFRRLKRAYSAC